MELSPHIATLLKLALEEDMGSRGDVTSCATISESMQGSATFIAKSPTVICGHDVAAATFRELEPSSVYEVIIPDGEHVIAGALLSRVHGSLRSILSGERTALNFLQRLSGIAQHTAHAVDILSGTGVRLRDTRKTAPGWRELDKYAVRCGGGVNHRAGLFDAVLIKNNHIDALGGDIGGAIDKCRKVNPDLFLQVEVRNMQELESALIHCPDGILLDNMTPELLQQCIQKVKVAQGGKGIQLEASGGIRVETLRGFAVSGLDYISMGEITHSVQAADIALRINFSS